MMARQGRAFSQMTMGLSLDGSQFSQTLKTINQQVKLAESNMRANMKILGNAERSYEDLAKSLKDVNDVYKAQERKMAALRRAYDEAKEQYGENSKEAQKYAAQINNLAGTMSQMDRQIRRTKKEMVYLEEGVEDTKKAMAAAAKESKDLAQSYRAAGRQVDALAEEQKDLAKQMAYTENLMGKQQKVIARLSAEFGENSQEVKDARKSYDNLSSSLRNMDIRLQGTTNRLSEMGAEGASANAQLQRSLAATEQEIRDVERAMGRMAQGSDAFNRAQQRVEELRASLGRIESSASQAENAIREIGNQQISTSEVDEMDEKINKLETTAKQAGLAIAAGIGGSLGGILSQLDEAVNRVRLLGRGVKGAKKSLQSGVVSQEGAEIEKSVNVGATVSGRGQVDPRFIKNMEGLVKAHGVDSEEVSRMFNMLVNNKGMSEKEAVETIEYALKYNLKDIDSVQEYILTTEGYTPKQLINSMGNAKALGLTYNEDQAGDFFKEFTNEVQTRDLGEYTDRFGEELGNKLYAIGQRYNKGEIDGPELGRLFTQAIDNSDLTDMEKTAAFNEFVVKAEEMGGYEAARQMLNGSLLGDKITPKYSNQDERNQAAAEEKEVQSLIDAQVKLDELIGSMKAMLLELSVKVIPILMPVLEALRDFFVKYGDKIAESIRDFIKGFVDASAGIKDGPLGDFVGWFYGIIEKILLLFNSNKSAFETAGGLIGTVVGALSALALINLPLRGIGMMAKLFGAKSGFVKFLSAGVIGKATKIGSKADTYIGEKVEGRRQRSMERYQESASRGDTTARQDRRYERQRDREARRHTEYNRNERNFGPTGERRRASLGGNIGDAVKQGAVGAGRSAKRAGGKVVSGAKNTYNKIFNRNQGITPRMFTPEFEGRVAAAGQRNRARVGKVAGGVGKVAGGVAKGAVGAVGKVAGGVGKGIGGLAKGAMGLAGGPVGILMMAIPLLIPLIKKLYTNFEPFKNLVDGTWAKLKEFWAWLQPMLVQAGVWIKEKLVGAWEAIKPALQSTWETIKTVVSAIWTFLQPIFMGMWNLIKTVFTGIWNTIRTVFGYVWTFLQPLLVGLWNLYKTYFTFIWNLIKTVFTGIWNTIKTVFTFVKDFIFTTVPTIYNNIKTGFDNIWTKTKETFSNVKNNIVGAFNYVKEKVIGFKDAMVGRFGDIKDGIVSKVSDIVADVKAMPGKIADGLANGASALKRGGATMINGLVGAVEGGINKVIGGINTAMGWFGISKKLGEVKFGRMDVGGGGGGKKTGGGYVPQYARGTRGKPHPGGPALVNDAKGSSYREYIEFPNGEGFIPKGRNVQLDLPKGTHVMDAKSTKKYAGIGHIPAYANGTAWDWTKEKISGGINWVSEKIKSLVDVKNKVLGFVAKKIGFDEKSISNKFIKGGGTKLINDASARIFGGKKHLDISEATAVANSGSSNFTGGMAAAGGGRINGVMGDLVRLVNNVISKYPRAVITSGFRPGARTEAGNYSDHATGRAMDISGYGSFGHPMYTKMADELFQSPITKYVIANDRWKYKNRFGYQRFPWGGHMNHVHVSAFKRGGFVNKPTLAIAGEAGPESIIPMSKSLRTRGLSLLHDTARQMGMEVQEKGKREIKGTSENVYNINLNYTGSASREDAMIMAQIVMDEIEKKERRNRRARGEK